MRAGFVQERKVSAAEALRRSLPDAERWLAGRHDRRVPPGTLAGRAGVEALAALVEGGLDEDLRAFLVHFAIRVGARRLSDAAHCLESLGLPGAASVAAGQARLIGGLQHPLVTGDDRVAADALRRLAPTYERLRTELSSRAG